MLDTADPTARARAAFRAYTDRAAGLTHDGRPIPDWDNVGDNVRSAWTAAATAAAAFTTDPDTDHPATLAGGHALVLQYGDAEFIATCQCGHDLGTHRPDRLDHDAITATWEHHVLTNS